MCNVLLTQSRVPRPPIREDKTMEINQSKCCYMMCSLVAFSDTYNKKCKHKTTFMPSCFGLQCNEDKDKDWLKRGRRLWWWRLKAMRAIITVHLMKAELILLKSCTFPDIGAIPRIVSVSVAGCDSEFWLPQPESWSLFILITLIMQLMPLVVIVMHFQCPDNLIISPTEPIINNYLSI